MAYGQTSSGKTYTLFGNESSKGIVPRFLDDIFAKLREFESCEESTIRLRYSFFEIYKEKILDALDEIGGQNLNIRENLRRGVFVENLNVKETNNIEKVKEDLESANSRRRINETFMNGRSSRSHFVITFDIEINYLIEYEELQNETQKETPDAIPRDKNLLKNNFYEVTKKSKIIFIDLAGSEKQTHNKSEVFEEGCFINKSLSILNHVVMSLSKNKNQEFIHYRDSKLTFFLKDIFKGNSHFNIIGTVLPYYKYMSETLNTLNFVSLAKTVKTNPQINFETKNNAQMMQNQMRMLLMRIEQLEKGDCGDFKQAANGLVEKLEKLIGNIEAGNNKEVKRISLDIEKFINFTEENPITWTSLEPYKDKVDDLTFNVTETLNAIERNISTELKLLLKRFEKTLTGLSLNLKSLKISDLKTESGIEPSSSKRQLLRAKTQLEPSFSNPQLLKAFKRNTEEAYDDKPLFYIEDSTRRRTPANSNSRIDFGFTKYYKELKGKPQSIEGAKKSTFNSFLKAVKASSSVIDSGDEKSGRAKEENYLRKSKFGNSVRNSSKNSSHREPLRNTGKIGFNASHSPVRWIASAKDYRNNGYKNFSQRDESLNLIREKALLDQERDEIGKLKEELQAQINEVAAEKESVLRAKDREIDNLKEELRKARSQPQNSVKSIQDTVEDSLQRPSESHNTEKLSHLNKKVANLERQLRNRNKDYLFALKELEKIKLTSGSNKICSMEDMDLD